MSYRVHCDENVEPGTVGELEAAGKTAEHVAADPGKSTDDADVAAYARNSGSVLLTTYDDFLAETGANLRVLYFPDNVAPAHGLAARVVELQDYYPKQDDLPGTYFLTADEA